MHTCVQQYVVYCFLSLIILDFLTTWEGGY